MQHVRIEDPGPIGSGSTTFPMSCNCACSLCMSGGCCMQPRPPLSPWSPGVTTSAADVFFGWACTSSGHDFAAFPNQVSIYCRKCGEFRP